MSTHAASLPCVGFELLYSPLTADCAEDIARCLTGVMRSTNNLLRMSFDVERPVQPGSQLLVMIANPRQPTERLLSTVHSCQDTAPGEYRVTIEFQIEDDFKADDPRDIIAIPIGRGLGIPVSIFMRCPACRNQAEFYLVANQTGSWGDGIMPLYNCPGCHTTRTILSLLEISDSE